MDGRRKSTRWVPFATGVSVGLVTGLVGVGLAVAWERVRRAHRAAGSESRESALDEELAQTFPASDPSPHPHRVD
jgi:hypothetical protein